MMAESLTWPFHIPAQGSALCSSRSGRGKVSSQRRSFGDCKITASLLGRRHLRTMSPLLHQHQTACADKLDVCCSCQPQGDMQNISLWQSRWQPLWAASSARWWSVAVWGACARALTRGAPFGGPAGLEYVEPSCGGWGDWGRVWILPASSVPLDAVGLLLSLPLDPVECGALILPNKSISAVDESEAWS